MTRNRDKEPLFNPDPELEKTLRRHLQQAKVQHSRRNLSENFEQEAEDMAEPNHDGEARKVLGAYTKPTSDFYGRSISIPAVHIPG